MPLLVAIVIVSDATPPCNSGWEFHDDRANIPGLEVVSSGMAFYTGIEPKPYCAVIYYPMKGGGGLNGRDDGTCSFVFSASTIFWAQGLSSPPGHTPVYSHFARPHGPDKRVERMTHNLLSRALASDRR